MAISLRPLDRKISSPLGILAHRLVCVAADLRYDVAHRYDAQGNRTWINADYYDHEQRLKTQTLWYRYDAMNRVTVSQGVNAGGAVGIDQTQGIELTYDAKGQRSSARSYGKQMCREPPDARWGENKQIPDGG